MAKGTPSYLDFSESTAWNVARDFSQIKIMSHLAKIDEYIQIANFGNFDLYDEFITNKEQKDMARIRAINRLAKTLEMLIRNTTFAVRTKHKPKMLQLKESILKIQKVLPKVEKQIKNERDETNITKIDNDKFEKLLNFLVIVAEEVLEPLNESDLIFTSIEEFDPVKLKKQFLDDLAEGG